MSDPVRLLHRRSEVGYTDVPALAMTGEPEAVSHSDQKWISDEAYLDERARALVKWSEEYALVAAALARVDASPHVTGVSADLRSVRHYLERIDKRLRQGVSSR